jgi:Ca-activated chloride channel family protein
LGVTLIIFLFWPQLNSSQAQHSSTSASLGSAERVAAPSQTLIIGAHTKDGTPADLVPADLQIRVDDQRVAVQEVHGLVDVPMRYCILFDSSASRRVHFQLQKDEATNFLSKVVKAERDHGMLVSFNTKRFVDADSANPQDLVKALDKPDPRGATALYDAIVASADRMSMSKNDPDPVLRIMFILSDGEDNASFSTRDAAVQAALKAGMKIYSLGQKNPDPHTPGAFAHRGMDALREFAYKTGGKAYFADKQGDIDKSVGDISDELGHLFLITLSPSDQHPNGRIHELEVKSTKKNVSISAPSQYYAPQP